MGVEDKMENSMESGSNEGNENSVYLPGQSMDVDEKLVHDPSAYIMLHNANTGM